MQAYLQSPMLCNIAPAEEGGVTDAVEEPDEKSAVDQV